MFVYVSFLVFNELGTSNDAAVKNETVLPTTVLPTTAVGPSRVLANVTRPAAAWREQRAPSYCGHPQPDRGARAPCTDDPAARTNVAKRSAAVSKGSANVTATTNTTATKPKPRKPSGGNATRAPPSRHPKTTKPTKKSTSNATGPKTDPRLSGGIGGGTRTTPTEVKTPPNRTDGLTMTVAKTDFKTKYPIDDWKKYGFYTDDYIGLINGHWLAFDPPSNTAHYILGFLYTVIMVFGCSGNALVIFMYIKLVRRSLVNRHHLGVISSI